MFKAFPKIGQFRNAVKYMKITGKTTLRYQGTVKLHGTNSAITYDFRDHTIRFQSRNRLLTLDNDNAGFVAWASQTNRKDQYKAILSTYATEEFPFVALYGEWCGGNIQSGVALNQLDKRFVAFALCTIDATEDANCKWHDVHPLIGKIDGTDIISDYRTFDVIVNSSEYAEIQNSFIPMVDAVENECPYAAAKGVHGIGEGIVWVAYDDRGGIMEPEYWFKTKGEKHSKSKVKVVKSVDTTLLIPHSEFSEMVVTEGRLEQGWNYLAEMGHVQDRTSTSHFIRWIIGDISSEESDLMSDKQVTAKDFSKLVATPARNWFFKRIESEL